MDGEEGPEDKLTLRLRLGLVRVKLEPVDEALAAPAASGGSAASASSAAAAAPASGAAAAGAGGRSLSAVATGDLRQLFAVQSARAAEDSGAAPEAGGEAAGGEAVTESQERQALGEAQIASYEDNVQQRRKREADIKAAVRAGDLTPLYDMDLDLMELLSAPLIEWLGAEENRLCLLNFLQLRGDAKKWYKTAAQAYFAEQREALVGLLGGDEGHEGEEAHLFEVVEAVSVFLREEVAKLQAAIWTMPEPGTFVPQLFLKYAVPVGGGSDGTQLLD